MSGEITPTYLDDVNGSSVTSVTSLSISPTAGRMVIVAVGHWSNATPPVATWSGGAGELTLTRDDTAVGVCSCSVFTGIAQSGIGSGTITVSTSPTSQSKLEAIIYELDSAGSVIQTATVAEKVGSDEVMTATLGAFGSDSITFSVCFARISNGSDISPDSLFTELTEGSWTAFSWYDGQDTTVDFNITNHNLDYAAGIAIEISESVSGVTLTVQSCLHGHVVDSPALVQANTLAVDETLHGHTVSSPVLIQANILSVDAALHGHVVGSPVLVQANVLTVDETLHGQSVDNLVLDVSSVLVVQETLHGQTVANIDLTQAYVLSVQDALHGHLTANVDLTQANILTVNSALHAQLVDNILLNTGAAPLTGERVVVVANESRTVLIVDESRVVDVVNEIRRVTFN